MSDTPTRIIIKAMRVLANDIQSGDGVANAAILEAALRLKEQEARIKRLEEESESRWNLAESAIASCDEMASRIKRLEEAVDAAINYCEFHGPVGATPDTTKLLLKELRKAKEAKLLKENNKTK